jgi:phosphohistidine phosphatase
MNGARRLVLVRHAKAKAEADDGDGDVARPLTARGRRDAAAVGRWLVCEALVPDLVVCSQARRAQETWTAASSELDDPPPVRVEPALYESTVATLTDVVAGTGPAVQTLVVVGHDPTISEAASALAGEGSDGTALVAVRAGMSTSGLAVLEVPGGWDRLAAGSAVLVRYAVPRG